MATYRGVPYEAGVGPTDKDVVLFAACPPPEELGFQPAPGHWRKSVRRAEVDAGQRPGTTSAEHAEVRRLKRENAELRRANEILKAASAFFAAELDRPQTR